MFGDPADEPDRLDKDVDIKDRAEKYDRCQKMKIPDDKPHGFM